MSGVRRTFITIAAGWVGLAAVSWVYADSSERLNLHQMVARAELVVRVRVREGALRYALVDVIEEIRGEAPVNRLRIAFRDFNTARQNKEGAIVFPDGQEEILFLVRYRHAKKKEKHRDLFELFKGAQGRITVPAEGSAALLNALRHLSAMAGMDPASQISELKRQIGVRNSYLLETALEELLRMDAGTPELYPRLIPLFTNPSPGIRVRSIRLVEGIFASSLFDPFGESPDQAGFALAAAIERARNDEVVEVRVWAVRTMAAWPDRQQVEPELRAIAVGDRSQEVRIEAERILYRQVLAPS